MWTSNRLILISAIIWYILTAIFSTGYYHADEHYQIIEFAGILDGSNESQDLPWEYRAQLRPALQPLICYVIFKACNMVSITDPHSQALILRLITCLLSIAAIYFFTNSCKKIVAKKNWTLFLILSYFIWFLPFINVRFSSETWSGITFLCALGLIIRDSRSNRNYLIIGSLFGLGFLFRYQVIFTSIGIVLWLLFIKKEALPKIALILASGFAFVLIGFFADSIFYGDWTFSTWNYFRTNLLEGKASEFGKAPWYNHFLYVFRYSFVPIGVVILTSFLILLLKKHKNIILWSIIPFIFVHSIISHKELRLLFPIINIAPIIIILAIQEIPFEKWSNSFRKPIKGFLIIILTINMISIAVGSLKPPGLGRVRIAKNIQEIGLNKPINLYSFNNSNPFLPWGLTTNFYSQQNVTFKELDLSQDTVTAHNDSAHNILVVSIRDSQKTEIQNFINSMKMKEVCKSVPEFTLPFLRIYSYQSDDLLILYSE